jgi:hypothetical protein
MCKSKVVELVHTWFEDTRKSLRESRIPVFKNVTKESNCVRSLALSLVIKRLLKPSFQRGECWIPAVHYKKKNQKSKEIQKSIEKKRSSELAERGSSNLCLPSSAC